MRQPEICYKKIGNAHTVTHTQATISNTHTHAHTYSCNTPTGCDLLHYQ